MLRNYFAAAVRNLARNRLYATLNILGLGVGLATALLIALYVRHETTFDQFLPDHEEIYLSATGPSGCGRCPVCVPAIDRLWSQSSPTAGPIGDRSAQGVGRQHFGRHPVAALAFREARAGGEPDRVALDRLDDVAMAAGVCVSRPAAALGVPACRDGRVGHRGGDGERSFDQSRPAAPIGAPRHE